MLMVMASHQKRLRIFFTHLFCQNKGAYTSRIGYVLYILTFNT
jgi:hypothetical protein